MDEKERQRALKGAIRAQLKRRTDLLEDTHGAIVAMLNQAAARIRTTLAMQPTDYQRWYLPQLQKEIGEALAELGRNSGAAIGNAAGRAWELGEALVEAPLEAVGVRVGGGGVSAVPAPAASAPAAAGAAISGIAPVIDTRQLFAMRAFMTDRIRDISVQAANAINTELGLVVIGAQAPAAATTRVTEILGEPSRARARRIVRTELNRVHAVAAQRRLEEMAQFVPGLKKQWRRSGKAHPRPHHASAHGQIQDVDKPYTLVGRKGLVRLMHPHDPKAPAGETINCGCDSIMLMSPRQAAT